MTWEQIVSNILITRKMLLLISLFTSFKQYRCLHYSNKKVTISDIFRLVPKYVCNITLLFRWAHQGLVSTCPSSPGFCLSRLIVKDRKNNASYILAEKTMSPKILFSICSGCPRQFSLGYSMGPTQNSVANLWTTEPSNKRRHLLLQILAAM